jgi:hypothetical protein
MSKYRIDVSKRNREQHRGEDYQSPVEYADTLREANKIRTRMARGCGLKSEAIDIHKLWTTRYI